jgi:murein DD-endopeptidase MepM/ murein hydrolase activator NlpD
LRVRTRRGLRAVPNQIAGEYMTFRQMLLRAIGAVTIGFMATAAAQAADTAPNAAGDDQFHNLFMSWQRAEGTGSQAMAVPSSKPLGTATFTSGYGVRSDPFRGQAAMHAGIDLAAPTGTAVYATADGVIDHASWEGGYGNMVEINHGKGLQTRFGHLSRILVQNGQMVHRGDLIALVGSSGRSTGPHLHYEVRMDGHAVNPLPYLQSTDYVVAMQQRASTVAQGGPEDVDEDQE